MSESTNREIYLNDLLDDIIECYSLQDKGLLECYLFQEKGVWVKQTGCSYEPTFVYKGSRVGEIHKVYEQDGILITSYLVETKKDNQIHFITLETDQDEFLVRQIHLHDRKLFEHMPYEEIEIRVSEFY